jgi:nucleotide-binding universal stress UspA family protein
MSGPEALTFVVGFDGSEAARRALVRVRDLGAHAGRVVVVAVTPDLSAAGVSPPVAEGILDARQLNEEACALLGAPGDQRIEIRTTTGDPAAVLVEVVREVAADLLVVGRRGGDFVARTLLGSVAQRVVQQAPCDVLVVA